MEHYDGRLLNRDRKRMSELMERLSVSFDLDTEVQLRLDS
jgi:hypothetical protein